MPRFCRGSESPAFTWFEFFEECQDLTEGRAASQGPMFPKGVASAYRLPTLLFLRLARPCQSHTKIGGQVIGRTEPDIAFAAYEPLQNGLRYAGADGDMVGGKAAIVDGV